jgi:hypothetical protein
MSAPFYSIDRDLLKARAATRKRTTEDTDDIENTESDLSFT